MKSLQTSYWFWSYVPSDKKTFRFTQENLGYPLPLLMPPTLTWCFYRNTISSQSWISSISESQGLASDIEHSNDKRKFTNIFVILRYHFLQSNLCNLFESQLAIGPILACNKIITHSWWRRAICQGKHDTNMKKWNLGHVVIESNFLIKRNYLTSAGLDSDVQVSYIQQDMISLFVPSLFTPGIAIANTSETMKTFNTNIISS